MALITQIGYQGIAVESCHPSQASFVEDVNAYLTKAAKNNPRLRYKSVQVQCIALQKKLVSKHSAC